MKIAHGVRRIAVHATSSFFLVVVCRCRRSSIVCRLMPTKPKPKPKTALSDVGDVGGELFCLTVSPLLDPGPRWRWRWCFILSPPPLLFPCSPCWKNNIVYFRSFSPVLCPAFNCQHEMHLLITNYLAMGEGIFRYYYIELVDCQPD